MDASIQQAVRGLATQRPVAAMADLAQLAAESSGMPMAYIVLRDPAASPITASFGLSADLLDQLAGSLLVDDCAYLSEPNLIADLHAEPRYRADPAVSYLRGHASLPLPGGGGAVCVTGPNTLPPYSGFTWSPLQAVGRRIVAEIEATRRVADLAATVDRLQRPEPALPATDPSDLDYRSLVDGMAVGILSIGPDERVMLLNPAGSAMLGLAADALAGLTINAAFRQRSANGALADAVVPQEQAGPAHRTVIYHRGAEMRELSVASASYPLPCGRAGVVAAFSDVTEANTLRRAEQALAVQREQDHAALQAAALARPAARPRTTPRRIGVVASGAAAAVLVTAAAVAAYAWLPGSGRSPASSLTPHRAAPEPQPTPSTITASGTFDAGSVVIVAGPYDGRIGAVFAHEGEVVDRGAPLLAMAKAELEISLRDAQVADIRAAQKLAGLQRGPGLPRARQAFLTAELDFTTLRRIAARTRRLVARGLVLRADYVPLTWQVRRQALQLQAARRALQADRTSDDDLRVAELERANADARLDMLRISRSEADVSAPVAGVVLRPRNDDSAAIGPGSNVGKGQPLFAIGDLTTVAVHAEVNEMDVDKVHIGGSVAITGDALGGMTLTGTVTSLGVQAMGGPASQSGPAFPLTAMVTELTPDQRARIRVGMSARLSIAAAKPGPGAAVR